MNYTSIEQSKKLLEFELNSETADMCYIQTPADKYRLVAYNLEYCNNLKQQKGSDMNLIPCWSLGELLDVINNNNLVYDISNDKNRKFKIVVCNADYIKQTFKFYHTEHTIVDMIVWLIKNGYIKKEKK